MINSRVLFADWLQEKHPEIYNRALRVAENSKAPQNNLAGMGQADTTEKSFWSKFAEAAAGLGTTYLSLKNQRDAMKINIARAEQGLPPIDPSYSAPVIRTQVAIDDATAEKLASTAGEGLNKILLFGGLALLAFMLIKKAT